MYQSLASASFIQTYVCKMRFALSTVHLHIRTYVSLFSECVHFSTHMCLNVLFVNI